MSGTFDPAAALAATSGGRTRLPAGAGLTPEESLRRSRLRTKASNTARMTLARLHFDEYQALYRHLCDEAGV